MFFYRQYQNFLFLAIRENLAIAGDNRAASYRRLQFFTSYCQVIAFYVVVDQALIIYFEQ